MRPRFWLGSLLMGLLAIAPGAAIAQEAVQVTGQVTAAATGQPMPGVSVVVKGTTIGTLTDGNGNYVIRVPAGQRMLTFSYIGYRSVDAEITGSTLNVSLEIQPIGLEGVVVTALGIAREKRDLGYSVQDVQGDALAAVPKANLVSALSGNVAGVQVTNAGPPGGSARIVIRGASSISGNNQPLIIVDGVPIDNTAPETDGYAGGEFGGIDYGNAAADIDPANIQSISVLKGPNAAALYGSRAANGAIVITTKTGRGASGAGRSIGLSATTSVMFDTPLRLPQYQNVYGQGFNGQFSYVDGDGGGVYDFVDESWGPKLDGKPRDQFTGKGQPWVAHPNNVRDFFDLGRTINTNVSFARSGEQTDIRLAVSRMDMDAMGPGSIIKRTGILINGGVDVTERFRVDAGANYVLTEGENRPGTGYDENNFLQQFVWFGRQVDISRLKNYKAEDGTQRNWNHSYHNNPYWIAYENWNKDTRDRIIGHVDLNYQFTDWLSAKVRTSRDWYEFNSKRVRAVNSLEAPEGGFGEEVLARSETNTDVIVTATRALTPDLTVSLNAGASRRDNEYRIHDVEVNSLTVPGIYSLQNAGSTPIISDYYERKRVNSLYGSASFNYRGFLNIDVTGRNDWSSTLPEEHNSFFYPSISGALVFTDAFGIQSRFLSSGKVRASWTRVGNDTDPFQLASVYTAGVPWNGIPRYSVPNELPNADLKPEETTAWEVGTDLGFFNERLGFVLTYYDSRTRDQILGVQVSPASGFTSRVLNAGEVRNWGWELLLNATPVRLSNGFQWDMTINFGLPKNEVVDLYGGVESYRLGSYWSLDIEARKGEPYGTMYGNGYLRDEQGRIIVEDGIPVTNPQKEVLGNYNPDWVGGINNRLRWGNWDLSFLIDTKQGGEVFSVTTWFGRYSGVLKETLKGRENGVWMEDADGDGIEEELHCDPGIVFPGVNRDGTPNTTAVCPQNLYHDLFGNHESGIFDASFIKLRELKLGYTLPSSWVNRLGFSSAYVALIGRNLWMHAKTDHIDPETAFDASNVQGLEFGQFPTARSIGFSVSIQP